MNNVAIQSGLRERSDKLDLTIRRVELSCADAAFIDEGRGRPVLLLHGAPMTSLGFVNVIDALRCDHRVIAPDLPGFGDSAPGSRFEATLEGFAAFIVEFCEALDLRDLTVFVNDSSGPIGLAAATKLGPRVTGIVVADTVPIPISGRAAPVRFVLHRVLGSRLARWLNRRLNLLPWLVANVAPLHRRLPRRLRRAMTAEFDTPARRDRVLDLFAAMATDTSFMSRTVEQLRGWAASTPALVLYGQFDPMRLVGGPARFRAMFPRSEAVIVGGEEHFPILGSGRRVAAAIRSWLERVDADTVGAPSASYSAYEVQLSG